MENPSVELKMDEQKVQESHAAVIVQQSTSLNLLCQYSDSEDEIDTVDVKNEKDDINPDDAINQNQYRHAESSDSSSSSSDDSDAEIDVREIRKKIETPATDESDNENDEPAKGKKKKEPLRVKGEMLLDDLPPIQDLEIEVDEKECLEIGTISSIVDQLLLVEAYPHSAPLDIDSVLFLDHGKKALGKVFDVIGQVSTPIYCIRFNSHEDIVSKSIKISDKVYCAPRTEYASFVIVTNIMGKGSDASWKNDVEVPENMIEYSDDEEERKSRKSNKRNNPNQERPIAVPRRRAPPQSNFSWHNNINHQQQRPYNWSNQQQPLLPPHFQNYNHYPQNPYNQ